MAIRSPGRTERPIPRPGLLIDRKSTRLNSSHSQTSYAVFCLEHTSELQSQSNLVCRLLLEKKIWNDAVCCIRSLSCACIVYVCLHCILYSYLHNSTVSSHHCR